MLIIDDILVSDDVIEKKFHCNLNACKGACCWEGDFGAPVEEAEKATLEKIYPLIKDRLSEEGKQVIEEGGVTTYFAEPDIDGTPLIDNGACAYLTFNESGIALCAIEAAYNEGIIDFKKPVSCHLYPLRVKSSEELAFTGINYNEWDICSAACKLGEEKQIPVYQFVKEGLIRKFGKAFYEELDAAAKQFNK